MLNENETNDKVQQYIENSDTFFFYKESPIFTESKCNWTNCGGKLFGEKVQKENTKFSLKCLIESLKQV